MPTELPQGTYRMACEWCRLPQFPEDDESGCACDSQDYEWMEACDDCGEFTDVDHIREREEGKFVCPSCDTVIA